MLTLDSCEKGVGSPSIYSMSSNSERETIKLNVMHIIPRNSCPVSPLAKLSQLQKCSTLQKSLKQFNIRSAWFFLEQCQIS